MITDVLMSIQNELKAPKGQFNKFGGYKYRSCEDILESVKPILKKNKSALTISDEIVEVGGRVYVKATATLKCGEEVVSTTAFAREAETKKGMDDSQITGTASSYARKYALNGLFAIDDTKDAETEENKTERDSKATPEYATNEELDTLLQIADAKGKFAETRDWIEKQNYKILKIQYNKMVAKLK